MIGGWLTTGLPTSSKDSPVAANPHLSWRSPLVMLGCGVAGEALGEIISGFLDEVRFA
jgi:hypothetical protein